MREPPKNLVSIFASSLCLGLLHVKKASQTNQLLCAETCFIWQNLSDLVLSGQVFCALVPFY